MIMKLFHGHVNVVMIIFPSQLCYK